jgi:uncharacterized protein YqeY
MTMQARARGALTEAIRAGDRPTMSALRALLSALANAEAVPSADATLAATSEHIAGAHAGLGAAEAERRTLTPADEQAVLAAEIAEREHALAIVPDGPHADQLRTELRVLRGYLD